MPTELSVRAVHTGGMQMTISNGEHTVATDYPLEAGAKSAGLKPLELLLASLGACGGSVVASLLKRARQPASGVEVEVRGQRRDEHPTVFTEISMHFIVQGSGVDPAAVERAIAQSERLCPVWAMLKAGTPIQTSMTIVDAD